MADCLRVERPTKVFGGLVAVKDLTFAVERESRSTMATNRLPSGAHVAKLSSGSTSARLPSGVTAAVKVRMSPHLPSASTYRIGREGAAASEPTTSRGTTGAQPPPVSTSEAARSRRAAMFAAAS